MIELTFRDYFSIALGCTAGLLVLLTIITLIAWSCRKKGRKEAQEELLFPLHDIGEMPGYQGPMTSQPQQVGAEAQPYNYVPPLQVGMDRPMQDYHRQPPENQSPDMQRGRKENKSQNRPRPDRERERSRGRPEPRPAGDEVNGGRRPRSRERQQRNYDEPDIILASQRAKSLERPTSLFRPIEDSHHRENRRLPPPPSDVRDGGQAGDMRRAFSDWTLDDPTGGYYGRDTPLSWQERFMAWKASQRQFQAHQPPPGLRDSRRKGQHLPEYLAGIPPDAARANEIS